MHFSHKIFVSTISDIVITIVGFIGTLYFARTLGAGPLGTFALGLTVVQMFLLVDLGIGQAAVKRISSDNDPDEHYSAAILIYALISISAVVTIFLLQDEINSYTGDTFALLVASIFVSQRLYQMVNMSLKSQNRAHVRDSIDSIEQIARVSSQGILVYIGFETIGLFAGYAASFAFAVILAAAYHIYSLSLTLTLPSKEHFYSLYIFSRYSWLGNVKSRALSKTDILIMGFFISNSMIGIYQVSWTLAMTFQILGQSIGRNLFPEISEAVAAGDNRRVALLAKQIFIFGGLLPIPGIVGAAVLGDRFLGVYGSDFMAGAPILGVLAVVSLIRAYEGSVYALANGIDEPRITFISNILFIVTNIVLNFVFIYYLGALGAAAATTIALGLSVTVAIRMTRRHIDFQLPVAEISKQIGAATVMGAVVWTTRSRLEPLSVVELLILTLFGVSIYFGLVLAISDKVRSTLFDFIPRAI